jgi:hypothetical protein
MKYNYIIKYVVKCKINMIIQGKIKNLHNCK